MQEVWYNKTLQDVLLSENDRLWGNNSDTASSHHYFIVDYPAITASGKVFSSSYNMHFIIPDNNWL